MEKYCIWNYLVTRLLDNFKEGLSKLEFKINKKASLIEERFVAMYPTNIIILRGGE